VEARAVPPVRGTADIRPYDGTSDMDTPRETVDRDWRKAQVLAPLHRLVQSFRGLSFYESFEHSVVLILTLLIIGIVASATWHLMQVVGLLIVTDEVHPANQAVFQTVFGMIFTVIIALEFKHSLLIVLARQESVVRVRSIILIAMLAMVRKFIILDLGETASNALFALSAAILALGIVYWLVREEDRGMDRIRAAANSGETGSLNRI
jgi:uncharacterized membrane protein (DUF373 family)